MPNDRAPDFMLPVDGVGAVMGWDNAADLFDGPIATLPVRALNVGATGDGDIILFIGVESTTGITRLAPVCLDSECARVLHAALGDLIDAANDPDREEQ